jgi:hypothetical protein
MKRKEKKRMKKKKWMEDKLQRKEIKKEKK